MLLSDIRQVSLNFIGGSPQTHLVHKDEVERFIEASKRLHFKPGKNPHNGEEASKIWQITVGELKPEGPFWWSTPDLQNNDDPAGARMIVSWNQRTVWVDKETTSRWAAEEAEAEARHYREQEREAAAGEV